jgi:hypothetical protein
MRKITARMQARMHFPKANNIENISGELKLSAFFILLTTSHIYDRIDNVKSVKNSNKWSLL